MNDREIIQLVEQTATRVKESYSLVVAEQLKAVHLELKRLNDSFVKQNGRVNELEKANAKHHIACPNTEVVGTLVRLHERKALDCPHIDKIDNIVNHSVALKTVRKAAWQAAGGVALIATLLATLIGIGKSLQIW